MFGFGKKKPDYFSSKVLMTRAALNKLLIERLCKKEILAITFFTSTRAELLKDLNDESLHNTVINADKILNGNAIPGITSFLNSPGKKVVFIERYPLNTYEVQVAEKLATNGIPAPYDIFATLDDALMLHAGGERVKALMLKMGMKEDEIIEHNLIESSIENLQAKIAKKISFESHFSSPEEWFRINLPESL
ncbi:hypothetical protein BH09BAC5_BH09BAC5_10560 [soil metagenome]